MSRGDFANAGAIAAAYLKADTGSAAAWVCAAQAHIGQAQPEQACSELRRALEIAPSNIDALYYLGKLSGVLAQAELQQLYRLAPNSARVHQLMAESYHARENAAEEEKEYRLALLAEPRSVAVLIALGDVIRYQGRYGEAMSYYKQAERIDPRNYDALYGVGACHLLLSQPERAVEYFHRALRIDSASAAAHFALGDALIRLQRHSEALAQLNAALALQPEMKQAYAQLGRVYQRLGRVRESRAAFQKYQQLSTSELEDAAFTKK